MSIKLLDHSTINQICAGEIIDGPSAIIKELIENAIDACASKIIITIHDSGKTFISVQDNGTGIMKEDLDLAITRHATSKLLSIDDLDSINSFGFRGEALASIDSVSKVKVLTKTIYDEHGYKLELGVITPVSHPLGTTIVVNDLFYKTPARLKFLKSNSFELNKCLAWIKRLAAVSYNVEFVVKDETKEILHYPKTDNYKNRIFQIFKNEENFTFFEDLDVKGVLSLPTYNKSNSFEQFFFVNNRFIKDKIFQVAIKQAYGDLVPNLRYPSVCVFLNTSDVDVNVHPSKTEVRFTDSAYIISTLISSMKRAINAKETSTHLVKNIISFQNYTFQKPDRQNQVDLQVDLFEKSSESVQKISPNFLKIPNQSFEKQLQIETIPEIKKSIKVIGQFKNAYLLIEHGDDLFMIDQHAAHERIVFEKLKQKQFLSFTFLTPDVFYVSLDFTFDPKKLFEFEKYGFRFQIDDTKKTDKKVAIKAVPEILKDIPSKELFETICDDLKNSTNNIYQMINERLGNNACKNSIKAGRNLSNEEIAELFNQMNQTDNSAQCNHGRPTYIKLSLNDINNLFGRS